MYHFYAFLSMFGEIYQDTIFEHEDLTADVSVDFFWRGYWLMLSTKHRVWTSPIFVLMKTGWGKRWHRDMPILYIFSVAWEELEARQHLSAPILENTGRWQAAIFVNQLSCLTNNPWLMLQSHTRHHQPLHLWKAHCQQNKAHKWVNKGGFHTPIAGWFLMENQSINDGWFRGNPHCRKPNGKW